MDVGVVGLSSTHLYINGAVSVFLPRSKIFNGFNVDTQPTLELN